MYYYQTECVGFFGVFFFLGRQKSSWSGIGTELHRFEADWPDTDHGQSAENWQILFINQLISESLKLCSGCVVPHLEFQASAKQKKETVRVKTNEEDEAST